MAWQLLSLELEPGDFCFARFSDGAGELSAMFYAELHNQVAVLRRLDVQGAGPNRLGWPALRQFAQWLMEALDVDELRVEGAARTSGAGPGRRPAPIVFRRPRYPGA